MNSQRASVGFRSGPGYVVRGLIKADHTVNRAIDCTNIIPYPVVPYTLQTTMPGALGICLLS